MMIPAMALLEKPSSSSEMANVRRRIPVIFQEPVRRDIAPEWLVPARP
jgi:hypothetical protein